MLPKPISPPSKKHYTKKLLPGDWICTLCDMNNFASRSHCLQCGSTSQDCPRPADRPGDWSCPNDECRYHNFASRTRCYKCQTTRPLGIPIVESVPVEARIGDWKCPNDECGFLNFQKRTKCIKCATPNLSPKKQQFYSLFGGYNFFNLEKSV
ncbi:hypothetical protein EDD86DRAFT_101517 [Gorgonomyces haynaldii]|nr:hypothetical protein EDD86DRAFT_101517 [Gorgonomyces haynaldii]